MSETEKDIQLASATGVINRQLPKFLAEKFYPRLIADDNGFDVYQIESDGQKVIVSGSTAAVVCRGFYAYLKDAGLAQVTWSGKHVRIPSELPKTAFKRVVSPYKYRLYYNMCTFGYSTVWWDWPRWERELDWMALHGVNMPLALEGQEAIWQKLWNSFGISNKQLENYFTGPAFLPWHRCGNINGYDGPLPQGWIEQKKQLQQKILNRMRQLGMKPVVPAFSGFVPAGLKEKHPGQQIFDISGWAEFTDETKTHLLSPDSSLFEDIGKRFIRYYQDEYGPTRYYLADSFNENAFPDLDCQKLAGFGKSVYNSIKAGNPDGVWLMQGWMFYFQSKFWGKDEVKSLLSGVPDDGLIIIDLGNEMYNGWKEHDAFGNKRWIYSVIHNFGGNNPVNGDLKLFADGSAEMLESKNKGRMCGFGISPEGIENNEAVYELLTDIGWSDGRIDVNQWIKNYCRSRYGGCPAKMENAWQLLLNSAYRKCNTNIRHAYQARPKQKLESVVNDSESFFEAVKDFIDCSDELADSDLYKNDLIELIAQAVGVTVDNQLQSAVDCYQSDKTSEAIRYSDSAFNLLSAVDGLIDTRKDMRLETWLENAQSWAVSEDEKDYYRQNALRLITIWGGPILGDYASRTWSGLIRDYYAARWRQFLDSIKCSQSLDLEAWQSRWICRGSRKLSSARRVNNVIDEAKNLFSEVQRLRSSDDFSEPRSEKSLLGRWQIKAPGMDVRHQYDVSQYLLEPKCYQFQISSEAELPDIGSVILLENGEKTAQARLLTTDDKSAVYSLELDSRKPGAKYSVEFNMISSGEIAGEISIVSK